MSVERIPFLDLRAQLERIRPEIEAAIAAVTSDTAFILGPAVNDFEARFAEACGAPHCVAVSSGTSALHLALLAAGVGPGDEVITVPLTFIATVEAIWMTGATPVLVDIDDDTLTMDTARVAAAVSPRTRAVIPVHLYGQMAAMEPLLALAEQHGFAVIEDACQSHLARQGNRRAGSVGHAGCFSFYPGKNLGAYGEGGAVVTANADWAAQMRCLRDHGQTEKHHHERLGFNYRMDGIQGAVLGAKLRHLAEWTRERQARAAWYAQELDGTPLRLPVTGTGNEHVYHLYVVRHPRRDELQAHLDARAIATGLHYPIPVHLQKACEQYGWRPGDFPVSEKAAREVLSLPIYPELERDRVARVAAAIREWLAEND